MDDRQSSELSRHRSNVGPPYRGLQTVLSCHGIGPMRGLPTVDYRRYSWSCHGIGLMRDLPTVDYRQYYDCGRHGYRPMSHLHVLPFLYTLSLHNYLLTRGSGVIVSLMLIKFSLKIKGHCHVCGLTFSDHVCDMTFFDHECVIFSDHVWVITFSDHSGGIIFSDYVCVITFSDHACGMTFSDHVCDMTFSDHACGVSFFDHECDIQ